MVENDATMLINDRSHRDKRTSISSDDYFNDEKIENEDEAKSHLKNYSKAPSISSADYFNDNWNHSNDSFQNHTLNNNDFNIQSDSAKYFRSKKGHRMKTNEGLNRVESGFDVFSSNREQDLNMIKNSVQNGARRLSDYFTGLYEGMKRI
ncbi:hypothetical protein KAFR_0L01945 [Kazachstania africana CBS 2517]|uniref:Uncharacterized protein n=1 Tax=Kazachstania africana (strain ATCC 22294 / BCRC 22015 / CBS 2517 / CECT 1963 / NBRC 1671 / NRRL Y-8276) TaxID=1071382 RepID=H2B2F5_KAZAF|nr:hypothetical protein KAFR_0L01945 [Kazachstania africana CBS 2517]CCF60805.1 hypothetical protein KAFR_0L01945 [Kazachstania africana CBS 2517]